MILVLALTLALAVPLLSRLLVRDFASPPAIYCFVWGTTVALLFLGTVDYPAITDQTWWAIALSGFCFLVGATVPILMGLPLPEAQPRGRFTVDRVRFEWVLGAMLVLGAVGLLLQLVHLETTVGLATYWRDPVAARKGHTNIPIWGYLNLLNVSNFALATLYLTLFRAKPLIWALFVFGLVSCLFTTDRTRLYYMILWSFFVWTLASGGLRFSARKFLRGSALAVGLLVFFILFAAYFQRTYANRYPQYIHFPRAVGVLADPYIYLTGSLPALQAFMAEDHEPGHGRYTFSPVMTLASIANPEWEPPSIQGKLYFVPVELNTYTYLQQFYLDFGWLGMALGPLVCGLLCGWLYVAARKRPSPLALMLAGLAAFCCTISIFVNHFTQEATWFFAGVCVLVHFILRVPKETPGIE